MQKKKGKAPALWLYVKDILGDPQLQMSHPITRGIWLNYLCYMWLSPHKGELEGTMEDLQRLGSCSPSDMRQFMEDARKHKFCDIETPGPGLVTVINRRMSQDDSERRKARERKRLQRERQAEKLEVTPDVTEGVTEKSHPHITVCSMQSPKNKKNSSEESPPPEPEIIISIQLIKRDGLFHVHQKDIDEWEDVFPGINVLACLKYIKTWNHDNLKKRKTTAGIRRHITTWLEKEQNKGARSTYFKHQDPEQVKQFKHKHKIPDDKLCGDCEKFGACGTGAGSQVCVQKSLAFKERHNKYLEDR